MHGKHQMAGRLLAAALIACGAAAPASAGVHPFTPIHPWGLAHGLIGVAAGLATLPIALASAVLSVGDAAPANYGGPAPYAAPGSYAAPVYAAPAYAAPAYPAPYYMPPRYHAPAGPYYPAPHAYYAPRGYYGPHPGTPGAFGGYGGGHGGYGGHGAYRPGSYGYPHR